MNRIQLDDYQIISMDFGRSWVKAKTEFEGQMHEVKFKSIVGDGRDIDLSKYKIGEFYIYEDADRKAKGLQYQYLVTKDKAGELRIVTDRGMKGGKVYGIGDNQWNVYKIAKRLGLI